jgi:acetylornithine deacetylase/succinyl-diaminopimelate desuccinylase-like protein
MQQAAAVSVETAFNALHENATVAKMLAAIEADAARTLAEQRALAEIPSPPFKERRRAEYFLQRFHELGLADAAIDSEGNVVALRRGSGRGPRIAVVSHLDSVFAEGTDVSV